MSKLFYQDQNDKKEDSFDIEKELNPIYADIQYNQEKLLNISVKNNDNLNSRMTLDINPVSLNDLDLNHPEKNKRKNESRLKSRVENYPKTINSMQSLQDLQPISEAAQKMIESEKQFKQGKENESLGLKVEAITCYKNAILLNSKYSEAYNRLGYLFQDQGLKKEALQFYFQVIKYDQKHFYAHYNIGVLFEEEGKIKEAIDYYSKVLDLNPDFLLAYINRYMVNTKVQNKKYDNDIEKAEQQLDKTTSNLFSTNQKEQIKLTIQQFYNVRQQNQQIKNKVTQQEQNDKNNEENMKQLKLFQEYIENSLKQIVTQIKKCDDNYKKEDLEKEEENLKKQENNLQQQISKLQQQLNQTTDVLSEHGSQIYDNKKNIEKVQNDVDKIDKAVRDYGIYDENQMKQKLKYLQEKNPNGFLFYMTFYWNTLNMFSAYQTLSTGLVEGSNKSNLTSFLESQKDTISTGSKVLFGVGAEIFKGTVESIPLVGNLFRFIDRVVCAIVNASVKMRQKSELEQLQSRAFAVKNILESKFYDQKQISQKIAYIAIELVEIRENKINPKSQTPNKENKKSQFNTESSQTSQSQQTTDSDQTTQTQLQSLLKSMSDKKDKKSDSEFFESNNDSNKLALQDVFLVITHMCQNCTQISKNKDDFEKVMVDFLKKNTMEEYLKTQYVPAKDSSCCTIF